MYNSLSDSLFVEFIGIVGHSLSAAHERVLHLLIFGQILFLLSLSLSFLSILVFFSLLGHDFIDTVDTSLLPGVLWVQFGME